MQEKIRKIGKNRVIGIAALVVIIILGIALFGGRSEKSTIKKCVEGQMEGKAKKVVKLLPKEMVEAACEEGGYLDKKELIAELDEEIQKQLEQIEEVYGKGWKYDYEIVEKEDKSIEELREMRQEYQEDYNVKLDIKKAKEVEIEITVSSKDKEDSTTNTIWVDLIKVGRSWYIGGM